MGAMDITASLDAVSLQGGEGSSLDFFTCTECDAACGRLAGDSWRSSVYRGMYIDEFGVEHPAIMKAFSNMDAYAREIEGLAIAGVLGVGPARYMRDGVRWPGCGDYRLPDGSAISEQTPLVCVEDAGVNLKEFLDARKAGGSAIDDGAMAHANTMARANMSTNDWLAFCSKVLLDLCLQVDALQYGGSRAYVHGDIKLENICVQFYGPKSEHARATLVDFESMSRATSMDAARYPRTRWYEAALEGVSDARSYDVGCIALVYWLIAGGRTPGSETPGPDDLHDTWTARFFQSMKASDGDGDSVVLFSCRPDKLLETAAAIAGELELPFVDDLYPALGAARIVRERIGRRSRCDRGGWIDEKDKQEIGVGINMQIEAYYQDIARALNECYNAAVSGGDWRGVCIQEDSNPLLYQQNIDAARAIYGFLTDELGLTLMREGESEGPYVDQLTLAQLMKLERLEHERWLDSKKANGWRVLDEDTEAKLVEKLGSEGSRDPEKRKATLDGWKVNELMRPWEELSPEEQYMTKKMMECLVPILGKLGIRVRRV